MSDKPQSRNQDVCHRWHRNLLMKTGCHGDCCQAGAQAVLWGRERDLARRGRSFISRDKEKETTRPAWTINSLPDTHGHTDTHTHSTILYKHLKTVTRRKRKTHSCQSFSQSYRKSQKLKELICLLCGTKSLGTPERVYKPINVQRMKRGKYRTLTK